MYAFQKVFRHAERFRVTCAKPGGNAIGAGARPPVDARSGKILPCTASIAGEPARLEFKKPFFTGPFAMARRLLADRREGVSRLARVLEF
jgi:hypothetical protein